MTLPNKDRETGKKRGLDESDVMLVSNEGKGWDRHFQKRSESKNTSGIGA